MSSGKTIVFKLLVVSICITAIWIALVVTEKGLKKAAYEPGWYYAGMQMVDKPKILEYVQATRITPDSFDVVANVHDNYPLNAQGFISTFSYDSATLSKLSHKKKIMIIGDSFTQGAVPDYDSSFVARLIRMFPDIAMLNFGVSGADPLSYRLILQKYLALVKPDLVIVAFCGGNDEMLGDNRTAQNKVPMMWSTNFSFGGVETRVPFSIAHKTNQYFSSVDSMYQCYYHHFHIDITTDFIARWCARSLTGTALWFKLHPIQQPVRYDPEDHSRHCHEHLQRMKAMCDAAQVKMILAYIPPKNNESYKIDFTYLKGDCYYPVVTNADYIHNPEMDIHWNSAGHRKFALMLAPVIEQYCR